MQHPEKVEMYREVEQQLAAAIAGLSDPVAIMATSASIIHHANSLASWTGFYRVVEPELLRIGPYQGEVGCLEIPFSSGVCGAAARLRQTQIVPDVHQFPGHIACDARARSEIVVPVPDQNGELVAVLDVDSHQPAAFDESDREGLESIVRMLATRM